MIALSGVLLTLACLGVAWAIWRTLTGGGPVPTGAMAVAVLAPTVLILGCLGLADVQGRFGELRLSLRSIAVAPGTAIAIGGDQAVDGFYTPGLGKAAAMLRSGDGDRAPTVTVESAPTTPDRTGAANTPSAVTSFGEPGHRHFLGAIALKSGDALCLNACTPGKGQWYRFDGGARRLVGVGPDPEATASPMAASGAVMPARRALKLFPGLVWSPEQAIFPLRNYLPAAAGASNGGDCSVQWFCVAGAQGAAPVKSFLFQEGGLRGGWSLMLLDHGARLARKVDGALTYIDPPVAGLDAPITSPTRVTVWEARFADVAPEDANLPLGQLVERRALLVEAGKGGGLRLSFEAPLVRVAGVCTHGHRAMAQSVGPAETALNESIGFAELAGPLAEALSGPITPSLAQPCETLQQSDFTLARDRYAAGQFRLDWLGGPWLLAVIALGWAWLSWLGQLRLWRDDAMAFGLTAGLQMLLAMRMLFGVAGAAADPALDWRALAASSALAYVSAPALALLWGEATLERRGIAVQIALFIPVAGIALVVWLGFDAIFAHTVRLSLVLALAATGLAVMRWLWTPPVEPVLKAMRALAARPRAPFMVAAAIFALVAIAVGWVATSSGSLTPVVLFAIGVVLAAAWGLQYQRFRDRVWNQPWALVLLAGAAARIALGLLGVKERAVVAASAIYTPIVVIGFALLIVEVLRAARERPAAASGGWLDRMREWASCEALMFGFYGALAVSVIAVSVAINDKGYALVMLPILGFAGAWWGGGFYPQGRNGAISRVGWTAPVALMTVALVGLLVVAPWRDALEDFSPILAAGGARQNELAVQVLSRHMKLDDNMMRLFLLARPSTLASTGTASAEALRAWSVQLSDYTAPLFGRGYLTAPHLTSLLRPVQLSDNASAIHLMSPFGRVSAAALLLLLAALAAGCARATLPLAGVVRRSAPQVAGLLALWVMFGTAAYMILGNLQIAPFTGRNVYFLAPGSDSDLLEGLGLFAIALYGLGGTRRT